MFVKRKIIPDKESIKSTGEKAHKRHYYKKNTTVEIIKE